MQVVEQHEQVPFCCLLGDGARDRLPCPKARRVVNLQSPGVRRKLVTQSPQNAGPGVERRSSVVLGAPADDHGDAFVLCSQRELRTEPALPGAGLTGDPREHGMVGGLLEYADECGQLVVTADQGPAEMTCGR